MTDRQRQLTAWVHNALTQRQWHIDGPLDLQSLTGDAGFRRYYRLPTHPSLLAVDAPPDTEDSRAFVDIARFLRDQGVHTPEVVSMDVERGFLLVEDLGDQLYLQALTDETVDLFYGEALMTLLRMQQCARPPRLLPDYDHKLLRQEMELFSDWFVPKLLGYNLESRELKMLETLFEWLEESAQAQPQVFVHRDYHSRNLMVREGAAPGVVDFQDAVWGPITYDLASLLRDCYIRWPRERVEGWALAYGAMAADVGLIDETQQQAFLGWFDRMGLQRHIKVLGIFARLYLRDNKPAYLDDLPLVIRYTLEVAESYPELQAFADWFKQRLLPLAQQQPWYRDYTSAGEPATVSRAETAE